MRHHYIFALLLLIALVSCNRVSEDFRRQGAYAYNLVSAAQNGRDIRKSEVEEAMAKAKAMATNDAERHAYSILDTYLHAFRYADENRIDHRFLEVCRWEAAHLLKEEEPLLGSPAKEGDCDRLQAISTSRTIAIYQCEDNDSALRELKMAREAVGTSNPGKWLKLNADCEKRQKLVHGGCVEKAEASLPPLP